MTWRPESEADLRALIDSGDAAESHVLDFKREVGTSDGGRKETAADMASFAIDGGSLVIGVDEPEKDSFTLLPFDTTGVVERIEQSAANRIRPPLDVRPRVIPSEDQPGLGYVVVDIPESPSRPHMVDGRYYGRGERTRRVLDDAEVVRLLSARRNVEDQVRQALDAEIARNPQPAGLGRAFMVAVPLTADPAIARSFVRSPGHPILNLVNSVSGSLPRALWQTGHDVGALTRTETRSSGVAWTNLLGGGRRFNTSEEADVALDVEFQESGSIRLLVGRIVEHVGRPNGADPEPLIYDSVLLAWMFRLIVLAQRLSDEVGYRGSWGFGVHIYGMQHRRSVVSVQHFGQVLPLWDAPTYDAVTVATHDAVKTDRPAIVERLAGRLVAGLGTWGWWEDVFEPLTPPA